MANISINSSKQYLDNNGNPEALNSRIVPEYSSLMDFVQNAIKKLDSGPASDTMDIPSLVFL